MKHILRVSSSMTQHIIGNKRQDAPRPSNPWHHLYLNKSLIQFTWTQQCGNNSYTTSSATVLECRGLKATGSQKVPDTTSDTGKRTVLSSHCPTGSAKWPLLSANSRAYSIISSKLGMSQQWPVKDETR